MEDGLDGAAWRQGDQGQLVKADLGCWQWRWQGEKLQRTDRQRAGLGDQMAGVGQTRIKDGNIVHTKDGTNSQTTNRYRTIGKESPWGGKG